MKSPHNLTDYDRAQDSIREGDLLLCRRWYGASAAKAAWWNGELFCLEVSALRGARAAALARMVRRRSGRIDVYEVNPDNLWPEYDRTGATRFLLRLCGCSYGMRALFWAALGRLPVVRRFVRRARSEPAAECRPLSSSEACAMADRLGGNVDPTPHLADRLTEPADLARSPFYRYRFTLTAGEEP
jgi:hypothetical protein